MGKFLRGADNNKAALDPKRAGSQGAAAEQVPWCWKVPSRDSAAGEDLCVRVTFKKLRILNADSGHWHGDGGPAHFQ